MSLNEYARNRIVEMVDNKSANSISVKICKEITNEIEDIYIGTYYISPENSKEIPKDLNFFSDDE